jgi:hypothetical protein
MNRLLILVPSRGRPRQLEECFKSFYETAAGRPLMVGLVDDDDPELSGYEALDPAGGLVLFGPPMKCCPKLAWGYSHFRGYHTGMVGDDVRCRTPRWDEAVWRALEETRGFGVVGPNDGHRGGDWFNHYVMGNGLLKAIGKFVLPDLTRHYWCDALPNLLGRELGLDRFLPDVLWEHMSPFLGKGQMDATYEANGLPEWNAPGHEVVDRYKAAGLAEDAGKVKGAMGV